MHLFDNIFRQRKIKQSSEALSVMGQSGPILRHSQRVLESIVNFQELFRQLMWENSWYLVQLVSVPSNKEEGRGEGGVAQ